MILELYDNKTIQNSILSKYKLMKDKYIPESTLLDYLNNIIEGLSILHKNNIFNINLDPQNIYIDDNHNLKLNPYITLENLCSTNISNNNYFKIQAPELSKNTKNYTPKSDIWYLGLLIYEMTHLKTINRDYYDKRENIYNYIIKGNYPFNNYYSNDIKELIKLCLQYSQNRRPSSVELLKIIDIYKKNKIINQKLESLQVSKKSNKFNRKINLKEEIDKFNQTLARIKNYDNKSKYKIIRDLTPVVTRKNSKYNLNINAEENNKTKIYEKIKFNNINNQNKILRKPLKLKTCFIDNNKINFQKTGKKFFQIHKNNETLKGYLQTNPFNINKFVTKNPSYFNFKRNKTPNNALQLRQNYLYKLNNFKNNSRWNEEKDKEINIYNNIIQKNLNSNNKDFKRANSFNYYKINKKSKLIFSYGYNYNCNKIRTRYYSPFKKKINKIPKFFY